MPLDLSDSHILIGRDTVRRMLNSDFGHTAIDSYGNELYHYGVLGMKWGVRKEYQPVGRGGGVFKRKDEMQAPYETRGKVSGKGYVAGGS